MPADEVFEDSLFASLYDHFNGWDVCDDFYLGLARTLKSGAHVLDLGCGTGLLACRIAEEGFAVTGVDPAEGMLGVARARPGGERVSGIKSVGQAMRLPQRFDLIYMTGHAFQALLTDEDAVALLQTARDHLADDGLLAFETRNPARKAWLSWTPDKRWSAATADHGEVEKFFDTKADPPRASWTSPLTIGLPTPARRSSAAAASASSISTTSSDCWRQRTLRR